jgi:hypothetical protein
MSFSMVSLRTGQNARKEGRNKIAHRALEPAWLLIPILFLRKSTSHIVLHSPEAEFAREFFS